jgi:carbon monoxide dehydrogenase subunit G
MATVRKEITTDASPQAVWDAIHDIGALHTRLVPGFVTDTRVEPGGRTVTFANGVTVKELIVTLDEETRRLVWTAQGGRTTHYNSSVQVFADGPATRIVWISDFLPDDAAPAIGAAMEAGAQAMRAAMNRLAKENPKAG